MPGPSDGCHDRDMLGALQIELQALKAHLGRSLRLQRASPAEAPATAPFPIVLTFTVDPQDLAAAQYDVSAIQIQIQLNREALRLPELAGSESSTHGSVSVAPSKSSLTGARLTVLSDALPHQLRTRIAQELLTAWRSALGTAPTPAPPPLTPSSVAAMTTGSRRDDRSTIVKLPTGPFKMATPVIHLREQFVAMMCLVPELLEPYQAENEYGATVRRYAIINTDNLATTTTAPAPAGVKEAVAAAASDAPDSTRGTRGGRAATTDATFPQQDVNVDAASRAAGDSERGAATTTAAEAAEAAATATAAKAPVASAMPLTPADVPDASGREGHTESAHRLPPQPPDGPTTPSGHQPTEPPTVTTAHAAVQPLPKLLPTQPSGVFAPPPPPSSSNSLPPPPSKQPSNSAPPPPPGLLSLDVGLKELQYLQKRYSQVFSARLHADNDAGPAASSSHHQALLRPGCLTTFQLELLPTDPDWDYPAIRIVGQLLPVSPLCWLPSLGLAMGGRLPPWLRAALEGYLADQLTAAAAEAAEAAAAAVAAGKEAVLEGLEALGGGSGVMGRGGLTRGSAAGRLPVGGRRGPGRSGSGGRGSPGVVGYGACGGDSGPVVAPEGTVLLRSGALREVFRQLENHGGVVARAADAERQKDIQRQQQQQPQQQELSQRKQRQRKQAAGAATTATATATDGNEGRVDEGDDDSGGEDAEYGEGEGSGALYDDDGYGDGSHRREAGSTAEVSSGSDEDHEGGTGSEGEEEEEVYDEIRFSGAAAGAAASDDVPAAYGVVLEGLQLDGLAVVEVLRAHFEVSCGRCGNRGALVAASSAVAGGGGDEGGGARQSTCSAPCPACTSPWSIAMRPHYVHATANTLCVIKPQGCRPLDLLPSLMAGQCAECGAVMSLREVQVGLPFSRTCSSCHKELGLNIGAVSFVPRGPHGASRTAAAGTRGGNRNAAGTASRRGPGGGGGSGDVLRPGQPLPALGTCKHYRHSYRWLRFPCCGARFPCDLCHEEAVADGHSARWAQRMVCGFCSTEQPLGLQCAACGKRLAGSAANPSGRRTRFWEGGTGCRDVRRLDKNDPHKWRGRNKTVSAKATRVGPKPWSGKGGGGGGGTSSV